MLWSFWMKVFSNFNQMTEISQLLRNYVKIRLKWNGLLCFAHCVFSYTLLWVLYVEKYQITVKVHSDTSGWKVDRRFEMGLLVWKSQLMSLRLKVTKTVFLRQFFFSKDWAQKVQTFTYKRKSCSQEGNGPLTGTVVDLTCCSLSVT